MGAHAWRSYNMPNFMALLDPRLVGKPPVYNPKAPKGFGVAHNLSILKIITIIGRQPRTRSGVDDSRKNAV